MKIRRIIAAAALAAGIAATGATTASADVRNLPTSDTHVIVVTETGGKRVLDPGSRYTGNERQVCFLRGKTNLLYMPFLLVVPLPHGAGCHAVPGDTNAWVYSHS